MEFDYIQCTNLKDVCERLAVMAREGWQVVSTHCTTPYPVRWDTMHYVLLQRETRKR